MVPSRRDSEEWNLEAADDVEAEVAVFEMDRSSGTDDAERNL